jgi:hypothetical protein
MKSQWKTAGILFVLVVCGLSGNPEASAASELGPEVDDRNGDDEEGDDGEAVGGPRCNVLGSMHWTPYGSGQAGCNAACADLCGIPTGRIQTVWRLCICGS